MMKEQALRLDASQVKGAKMALAVAHALGKDWTADELAEYGARRLLALAKDQARKASGIAAEHVYTPDLSRVEDVKTLKARAEALAHVAHTYLNPVEDEPKAKAPPAAKPAPKAKAPAVRKAPKAAPSTGGANIEGF